ncbi:hypothetical protein KGP36_06220, partial [Patescibacteria group bacterium]|nr:hypothetical protein [Patescibacteria group bacterium]
MSAFQKSLFFLFALLLTPYSLFLIPTPAQASTLGSSPTYGPSTLYSGLIGWWTMDGKNTNWATGVTSDSSGNGNNGQMIAMSTSTSPVSGKIGQALKFSYLNSQYVSINNIAISSTSATYSCWINVNSYTGQYEGIFHDDVSSAEQQGLYEDGSNGTVLVVGTGTHGTAVLKIPQSSIPIGTWHHVVGTINGTTYTLYLDGKNVGVSFADNSYGDTVLAAIGRGNSQYFDGSVDDARIYNRALSASEINQLYQSGQVSVGKQTTKGTPLNDGLLGWWTFDGKHMTKNVADSSGNGYDGHLVNFTSTTTEPGVIGQALGFNVGSTTAPGGGAGFVQLPSTLPSLSGPLTVSGWMYVTAFPNTNRALWATNSNNRLMLRSTSEYITLGGLSGPTCTTASNLNTWVLATFVYDGTNISFYRNGALQCTNSVGAITVPLASSFIGTDSVAGAGDTMIGNIDDVRIYNRALSAAEVAQLYNSSSEKVAMSANPPASVSTLSQGLVGYWPFDGKYTNWATGKTSDLSGNGNNGQLIGMSTTTSPAQGKIGQALSFNGTSQYVDEGTPASLSLGNTGTVSAWIRSTAVTS